MKQVIFILFILLGLMAASFAQSTAKIEQQLVSHLKNIQEWSYYSDNPKEELLEKELIIFKKKLLRYTKRADVLRFDFAKLSEFMKIAMSPDGKFRIYSWDTEGGGTMHFYNSVYQFTGKDGKVYSRGDGLPMEDPGGFVSDIFEVRVSSGKIYLARFSSVLGNSLSYQMIQAFKIEGGLLNDKIRIFKTNSGLTNSIGFDYNFFSVMERKERPIKLILFDKSTNTVKIPIVIKKDENDYGSVTDKFINYKFNGKYFIKEK